MYDGDNATINQSQWRKQFCGMRLSAMMCYKLGISRLVRCSENWAHAPVPIKAGPKRAGTTKSLLNGTSLHTGKTKNTLIRVLGSFNSFPELYCY